MRNVLIICVSLLLSVATYGQEADMSRFWGVDYSMNKQTVDKILMTKKSNKGMSVTQLNSQTCIDKVDFDGEVFDYALFDFYRTKLLAGFFAVKKKSNEEATLAFLRLRERLTQQFGEPSVDTEDVICCSWRDDKRNIVQLTMRSEGKAFHIGLLYLNGTLNSVKQLDAQAGYK